VHRWFFGIYWILFPVVNGTTLRHGLTAGTGAELAERIDFAMAVQIEAGEPSGGGLTGSGVLLNQDWVLSAAHLVHSAGAAEMTVKVDGEERLVSEVHRHPGWLEAPSVGLSQRNDLVLLRLHDPVEGAPTVPIWGGGNGSPLIGLMAGFGKGGNGLLGAYLPADGLQGGMNVLDRHLLNDDGGFWVTDFDSGQSRHNSLNFATVDLRHFDIADDQPELSETVFTILGDESQAGFGELPTAEDFFPGFEEVFPEGTTALGDSGGPMFVFSDERARWELAGVTSYGVNPLYPAGFNRFDSRYGDLSFFTDVSSQKEWLDTVMVPEPSQMMLLTVSLFFAVRRKNRSSCMVGKNH